jgi:hypothetical protein
MTVTKKGNPTVESEENCREERSSGITPRSRAAELSRQIGQGISPANFTTLLLVVSQVTRIWRFSAASGGTTRSFATHARLLDEGELWPVV